MKTIPVICSMLIILFTATCKNEKIDSADPSSEYSGTITEQGMTAYQYGTHVLTNKDTFYALKSEAVNLDKYVGQEVTIVAEKIEGYPLEGGPEYLLVLEVK